MIRPRFYAMLLGVALTACNTRAPEPASVQAQYLYLWTASGDVTQSDFLAVLDVTERDPRYGDLAISPNHRRVVVTG
jgi:hypothetical protein